MISDYEKLKEQCNKKIALLQKRCPHKKTQWLDQVWAPGHYMSKKVKVCKNCNAILSRKEIK